MVSLEDSLFLFGVGLVPEFGIARTPHAVGAIEIGKIFFGIMRLAGISMNHDFQLSAFLSGIISSLDRWTI